MTAPAGPAPIVVQKYGGTSVATAARIRAIAERVSRVRRDSPRLVVVLSAMGKTTDGLVALAHEVSDDPRGREMDLLLATGEQVSVSLLGLALQHKEIPGDLPDRFAVRDPDRRRLQHRSHRVHRYAADSRGAGQGEGRDQSPDSRG